MPTIRRATSCHTFYQDANGRNATIYPDWTFRYRRDAVRWKPEAYHLAVGSEAVQPEPGREAERAPTAAVSIR